jgi:hypothetical protein
MICYQCHTDVAELSTRSRCLHCEHKRAVANEEENAELRATLEAYREAAVALCKDVVEDVPSYKGSRHLWESVLAMTSLLEAPLP